MILHTTAPRRVQMSRQHPWRAEHPDAVIVARPSRWGNPYKIGGHPIGDTGLRAGPVTAQQCVNAYRALFLYADWQRHAPLEPLHGRDLACWCPLDQPCHADVLLEIANESEETVS